VDIFNEMITIYSIHHHFLRSNHPIEQLVDLILAISIIATLNKVVGLLIEAADWVAQLEGPQEICHLLEVWADSPNLVDHVLHADHVVLAQITLHNVVIRHRNALSLFLCVTALVHKLTDALLARISPSDEWVCDAQHLNGRLVQLDEHAIVDLAQTKQLQNFSRSRMDLVYSLYADHKREFRLLRYIEIADLLSLALQSQLLALLLTIIVQILFSSLEYLHFL